MRGNNELKVFNWEKHPITDEWTQVTRTLKRVTKNDDGSVKYRNIYYLLFTAKNRRGQSNDTGLDVLVMQVNLNSNTWREIGWTTILNTSTENKILKGWTMNDAVKIESTQKNES